MAVLRRFLGDVDEAAAQVLRMSASTMERILRVAPREARAAATAAAGRTAALASSVPCVPGEALPPAAPGPEKASE